MVSNVLNTRAACRDNDELRRLLLRCMAVPNFTTPAADEDPPGDDEEQVGYERMALNILELSQSLNSFVDSDAVDLVLLAAPPVVALVPCKVLPLLFDDRRLRPPNDKSILRRLLPGALFAVLDVAAAVVVPLP